MKNNFKPGDQQSYVYTIKDSDAASFHGETVHKVCSTFSLAREIEWCSRLFVLEMKEENEEGVGTHLQVDHHAPAFLGEQITLTATVKTLVKNELICTYEVKAGDRLIASGETGQKIINSEKLKRLFDPNGKK